MIIWALYLVLGTWSAWSGAIVLRPGEPVPYADEIYKMIMKYVFKKPSVVDGDAIIDYLVNENASSNIHPEVDKIGVLDTEELKKVVEIGKKDFFDRAMAIGAANQTRRGADGYFVTGYFDVQLIEDSMDMMMQTIYNTRYNLNRTRPYRKKYKDVGSYHIGMLYGQLMRVKTKMESLRATMNSLRKKKWLFIYYLIVYTKLLAAHTDTTFIVRRMFKLHLKFMTVMDTTPSTPATPLSLNYSDPTPPGYPTPSGWSPNPSGWNPNPPIG